MRQVSDSHVEVSHSNSKEKSIDKYIEVSFLKEKSDSKEKSVSKEKSDSKKKSVSKKKSFSKEKPV